MMKTALLILSVFSAAAWAQVPEAAAERQLYNQLVEDFYEEIISMDAVTEKLDERAKAILMLKSALEKNNPNDFRFPPQQSWSWTWPPRKSEMKSSAKTVDKVDLITFTQIPDPQDAHSIKNLKGYVEARLGTKAAQLIAQGKIEPIVLGGTESSLPAILKTTAANIYKLPNLYELWGLKRYYVPATSTHKARLVYVVPPAKEYLEHYQLMLFHLTKKQSLVLRSENDFKLWKEELKTGVQELGHKLGGKFDYVALGYYNQWPQVLKEHHQILEQTELRLESGHMARYIKFQNSETGKILALLTLGHAKTIWGEASAAMLEGVFEFRPRGIIFLGSAGSISPKTQVYEISVPIGFRTKNQNVPLGNMLQLARNFSDLNVQAHFTAIHGNTSSPAAQTMSYLQKHSQAGTDTIDVEQSLIAERIAAYNREHQLKIQFGAVNLITDKPLGHAENDLDKVDHQKKSQARLGAVGLALKALTIERQRPTQCARIH